MPHSTLAATLRITSDICGTRNIVHPSSALRLIDHHLQASGIITACRVFARRDVVSGGPASFTEEERERFLQHYSVDDATAAKRWTLVSHPRAPVERLTGVVLVYEPANDETPVLQVRVGPTDVNFGNHADHAFLAETAAHALSIGDTDNDNDHEGPIKLALQ
jgi:hypothetical protein